MNNETLDRLNAFIDGYKAEIAEKDATIKQQNQILMHIKAEIEFIKQHPFDLVLIDGSVENISNVINGQTEPIIDEKDVVIDRLIHEAESIEKLKDKNIEDLHELYDLYEKELYRLKHVISARDLTIKSLTTMCQSSGTERNKLASTIEDLNTQLTEKRAIINEITRLRVDEVETRQGLEDELSALEQDSEVLMKVVHVITMWNRSPIEPRRTISDIRIVVDNYLDAPGGPPETPKDDPEVKTTAVEIEIPVDASRTIHLQKMRIDEQSETITRLVGEVKKLRTEEITATVAFLELP